MPSEGYYYLDLNPSGPGYVVGVCRGANAVIKLFKTDEKSFHGWLLFKTKKSAMKLVDQIKVKHPNVQFWDNSK
jgi:hypothetical protein